jgi:hypothetical protein
MELLDQQQVVGLLVAAVVDFMQVLADLAVQVVVVMVVLRQLELDHPEL